MTDKRIFRLHTGNYRDVFTNAFTFVRDLFSAGCVDALIVTVEKAKRSNEQNRKMWAVLNDIAKQVDWYGQNLDAEGFKHLITAGYKKFKSVPSIDGNGFVMMGLSTKAMTISEMAKLIEHAQFFGEANGVKWSNESLIVFDEMINKGAVRV
jgi:hypothetical protein